MGAEMSLDNKLIDMATHCVNCQVVKYHDEVFDVRTFKALFPNVPMTSSIYSAECFSNLYKTTFKPDVYQRMINKFTKEKCI